VVATSPALPGSSTTKAANKAYVMAAAAGYKRPRNIENDNVAPNSAALGHASTTKACATADSTCYPRASKVAKTGHVGTQQSTRGLDDDGVFATPPAGPPVRLAQPAQRPLSV
jgi:hypothetical protein